ncbi:hypothetical protein F4808DRAFT_414678 [Astrocystis sublimbata]|nr:hypothetical protein F4808DRAFT_414678 [Astrocystis sublimbata]
MLCMKHCCPRLPCISIAPSSQPLTLSLFSPIIFHRHPYLLTTIATITTAASFPTSTSSPSLPSPLFLVSNSVPLLPSRTMTVPATHQSQCCIASARYDNNMPVPTHNEDETTCWNLDDIDMINQVLEAQEQRKMENPQYQALDYVACQFQAMPSPIQSENDWEPALYGEVLEEDVNHLTMWLESDDCDLLLGAMRVWTAKYVKRDATCLMRFGLRLPHSQQRILLLIERLHHVVLEDNEVHSAVDTSSSENTRSTTVPETDEVKMTQASKTMIKECPNSQSDDVEVSTMDTDLSVCSVC